MNTLAKHFNDFSPVACEIPFYRVFLTKKEKTFKNLLTFVFCCDIILKRDFEFARKIDGGLAQLARASGSYPAGRWFKSDIRYHLRPVGQAVKTRPFHGCNMGSIPVRVTNSEKAPQQWCFSFFSGLVTRREPNLALFQSCVFRLVLRARFAFAVSEYCVTRRAIVIIDKKRNAICRLSPA